MPTEQDPPKHANSDISCDIVSSKQDIIIVRVIVMGHWYVVYHVYIGNIGAGGL